MRFTLLGSGAVRNNPRRAGPSQIVHVGEQRLLFDCGRGACLRLAQEDEKVEEIDRLFLTHLHFDHIVDVPYFVFVGWNNSRQNQLRITGPRGTASFLERLIRPPFEQDIASRLGHGKSEFGVRWLAPSIWTKMCSTPQSARSSPKWASRTHLT